MQDFHMHEGDKQDVFLPIEGFLVVNLIGVIYHWNGRSIFQVHLILIAFLSKKRTYTKILTIRIPV